MKKIVIALLLLLFFCMRCPGQENSHISKPAAHLYNYDSLIRRATACDFRGFKPSAEELELSEQAFRKLDDEKSQVITWIIASLKEKPASKTDSGDSIITNYGFILWRFGPEYVLKLEPDILHADDEQIRQHGAYILELGMRDSPAVAELTLQVAQRDVSPMVQVEALHALSNLHAIQAVQAILPFFKAEDSQVRKAAIQFFWSNASEQAVPALIAMLATEKDYDAGFWLAWTLCRSNYAERVHLLASPEAGIRAGALYYIEQRMPHLAEDEMAIILDRVDKETDQVCRYEIACILAKNGDVRCLPLLIGIFAENNDCMHPYTKSWLKTAAAAILSQYLPQPLGGITDEDRARAREERVDIYTALATRCSAWLEANRNQIRWDPEACKFMVKPHHN